MASSSPDSIVLRVSNSKLKTYRRCPKKYEYKYIQKLEPRARALTLERGSWIHELLQTHYDGEDWRALHKQRTQEFFNLPEEIRDDLGETLPSECLRIMLAYIRHWKEVDKHYTVVDTELNEYVTIGNIKLQVIIDLVVEDKRTGLLWAWDHKTRKNFENIEGMMLDPQLTLYFRALEVLGYTPLGGVTYNELRTKPPTVPQLLARGGLSKRANIDTDVRTYRREIMRHGLDVQDYIGILRQIAKRGNENFFRRRNLPKDPPLVNTMWKEMGQTAREILTAQRRESYPRTFIPQSCKWDCEFKNLCIAELHGADVSSLIKLNYRKRGEVD